PRGRPDQRKWAPHRRDSHRSPLRAAPSGLLVLGDVVDLQRREGKPAFGALVAVSAVAPSLWMDARERVLQGEIASEFEDIGLRQPGERRDDFERMLHAALHERREVIEELTRSVRKRV